MGRSLAANTLTFLILIMLAVGAVFTWGQGQFRNPGPSTQDMVFSVPRGANLSQVTDDLVAQGLISNAPVFRLGARYTRRDNKLKFGEYRIPARVSMDEILDILVSGKSVQYFITLPEGLYTSEIIAKIQADKDLSGEITDIPPEGMMAPNTYSFNHGDTRQSIVDRMVKAQQKILADAWAGRAANLPLKSPETLLVLASIVESEAGGAGEWPLVASVFYNRLAANMRLQADATLRYGLTGGTERIRRGLRASEIAKDTPYNTYVIPALPPTPISNPGKEAIMATANPSTSKFYYFVLDGSGGHAFAENYKQHQRNVAAWRKIEKAKSGN